MNELHDMVKHFEYNHTNRKNYDLVLQENRCLLINYFKNYHCGTRISAVRNLVRTCLRLKKAVKVYCDKCSVPPLLTEE